MDNFEFIYRSYIEKDKEGKGKLIPGELFSPEVFSEVKREVSGDKDLTIEKRFQRYLINEFKKSEDFELLKKTFKWTGSSYSIEVVVLDKKDNQIIFVGSRDVMYILDMEVINAFNAYEEVVKVIESAINEFKKDKICDKRIPYFIRPDRQVEIFNYSYYDKLIRGLGYKYDNFGKIISNEKD